MYLYFSLSVIHSLPHTTPRYTRVPVYENERENIVAVLNTKDLVLLDPDDKLPLRSVCRVFKNAIQWVDPTETLQNLLSLFKQGMRCVFM